MSDAPPSIEAAAKELARIPNYEAGLRRRARGQTDVILGLFLSTAFLGGSVLALAEIAGAQVDIAMWAAAGLILAVACTLAIWVIWHSLHLRPNPSSSAPSKIKVGVAALAGLAVPLLIFAAGGWLWDVLGPAPALLLLFALFEMIRLGSHNLFKSLRFDRDENILHFATGVAFLGIAALFLLRGEPATETASILSFALAAVAIGAVLLLRGSIQIGRV